MGVGGQSGVGVGGKSGEGGNLGRREAIWRGGVNVRRGGRQGESIWGGGGNENDQNLQIRKWNKGRRWEEIWGHQGELSPPIYRYPHCSPTHPLHNHASSLQATLPPCRQPTLSAGNPGSPSPYPHTSHSIHRLSDQILQKRKYQCRAVARL